MTRNPPPTAGRVTGIPLPPDQPRQWRRSTTAGSSRLGLQPTGKAVPMRCRLLVGWVIVLAALLVAGGGACASAPPQRELPAECGGDVPGFAHRDVQVDGASIHVVSGGHGPAVVLVHGFPETWWTWREVMVRLAETHTVIAVDLRGVGCSSVGSSGYDADSLAADIHAVMQSLKVARPALVGHDTGGWVAYAYARRYREDVSHLVLSGTAIPGFGLEELLDFRQPGSGLAHLPFFMQERVPELLIGGREQAYFDSFVTSPAMHTSGVIGVYARSYARPGRLTAALGQYRALYADARNNRANAGALLTMPTLSLSGSDSGETTLAAGCLRRVAIDVSEVAIPDGGHYVQEERPTEMAAALQRFLG